MTFRPCGRRAALLPVLFALCASAWARPAPAYTIETAARHAIILDVETGSVLLEREADAPVPPASMSKLMTIYMVFERLKDGRLTLDDKLPVSRRAWRKGGSKMFVMVDTRVRLEDLLRGIIVQSGNDACIVVAEAIGGSEEKFAEMMTARAQELGLEHSTFRNATGWPDDEHLMSVRDIASLSQRLIEDFPEYYPMFAESSFRYSRIKQYNRNPLLRHDIGADGLKTGYTEDAGYGLAASAQRDGRRVVLVLAGLPDADARARESLRLMDIALNQYRNYKLFSEGDAVHDARVWLGDRATVPLVVGADVGVTLRKRSREGLKAVVSYSSPLLAPLARGQPVARLVVTAPGFPTLETPLLAGENVAKLGLLGRIGPAIGYLFLGEVAPPQ